MTSKMSATRGGTPREAGVLEGDRPDVIDPQRLERVEGPDRETGRGPGEVLEFEARVEDRRGEHDVRVEEVRVGPREEDVAPHRSEVCVGDDTVATAEEVVLGDADVEQELVTRAVSRRRR